MQSVIDTLQTYDVHDDAYDVRVHGHTMYWVHSSHTQFDISPMW